MTKPVRPEVAVIEARRVGTGDRSGAVFGDVTYTVLADPPGEKAGERRSAARHRTRLRSGKIVNGQGSFVSDCLVYDVSARGSRLRLPPDIALPLRLQLFDEQTGQVHRCSILWRDGSDVGIRFDAQPGPQQSREIADALRRKYYAVRN